MYSKQNFNNEKIKVMKIKGKKILKWTGIIIGVTGTGIAAYALITHPEIKDEIVGGIKKMISGEKKETKTEPEPEPNRPVREGRNQGGYYKPRYNNKNQN